MKLTFLWCSRLSCSLSLLAYFSNVAVPRRSCLQCIPSYRHPLHRCAGVSLLWSLIQLMEGCVKLPSSWPAEVMTEAPVARASELHHPCDIRPKYQLQWKPLNTSESPILKYLWAGLVLGGLIDDDDARKVIWHHRRSHDDLELSAWANLQQGWEPSARPVPYNYNKCML